MYVVPVTRKGSTKNNYNLDPWQKFEKELQKETAKNERDYKWHTVILFRSIFSLFFVFVRDSWVDVVYLVCFHC